VRVARSALVRAGNLMRPRILALFWLKIGPFKSLQTYPILACLLNPLLRARSRPFICIGRSSTPAAETTTSFSWAQRHFMARGSSGGERRPCHPRPSSCTYFLPSIACVCCPPAASSARLLLPPAVLTRPPVVLFSLLSLQVLHATVAAAVRSRPALSSISWPRAFERCKQRFQAKNFGACGGPRAIVEAAGWRCRHHRVWLSYRVWGYFSGVRCGWSGRKWSIFFLLQKWIDLDELNPMVWVPSIVRRRIDFSLAVFELGAPRALHP
jgi:hypothetical protein